MDQGVLRAPAGGYANEPGQAVGLTPITAGMLVLRRRLGMPPDPEAENWLRDRLRPEGGFAAAPGIPVADLMSTATAVHALRPRETGWEEGARLCRRFLKSVWERREGGFCASAFDRTADCEYTWYGLLALGSLPWGAAPRLEV